MESKKHINKINRSYYLILVLLLLVCCTIITGCKNNDSNISKIKFFYTENLEFFVGEEWHDDEIGAEVTYKDSNTKFILDKDYISIDKSEYDKTKVGSYTIYLEYKGYVGSYVVKVVSETTNSTLINDYVKDVLNNKLNKNNNLFEISSTYSQPQSDGIETQSLQYKNSQNNISLYYNYTKTFFDNTPSLKIEILYNSNNPLIQQLTQINGQATNSYYATAKRTADGNISVSEIFDAFDKIITDNENLHSIDRLLTSNNTLSKLNYNIYANLSPISMSRILANTTIKYINNINLLIKETADEINIVIDNINFVNATNIPLYLSNDVYA